MSGALMVLAGAGAALPRINDRTQEFIPQSSSTFFSGYLRFKATGVLELLTSSALVTATSLSPEWGTNLSGTGTSGSTSKGAPYEVRCVWISGNVELPAPPGTGYVPLSFSTWYSLDSDRRFDIDNQADGASGVWRFDIRRIGSTTTIATATWTVSVNRP